MTRPVAQSADGSAPARRDSAARTASTSACSPRTRRAIELLAVRRRRTPQSRRRVDPLSMPQAAPHATTTGTPSSRASGRAGLRLPGARAVSRRSAGCGSTARRCCSILYGLAVAVPDAYDREAAAPARRQRGGCAMKSVVADPGRYDWEGRRAAAAGRSPRPIIYELHVRGFTRHPSSGVAPAQARHLRGPDREDSVPAGSGRHRRRAACRCSSSIPRTRRPAA